LTFGIIAKNATQTQAKIPISGRDVVQPTTLYTCPVGKRAIVKGRIYCTSTGAAANANLNAAGEILYRWLPAGFVQNYLDGTRTLSATINQMALFEVELAAGEILELTQSSGSNAEFNFWIEVLELPS